MPRQAPDQGVCRFWPPVNALPALWGLHQPCLGLPYPSRWDRPSLDPMANRALGDAKCLGYSLLATVSLDEFLYVHDADYSCLNYLRLGCCNIRLGR